MQMQQAVATARGAVSLWAEAFAARYNNKLPNCDAKSQMQSFITKKYIDLVTLRFELSFSRLIWLAQNCL